MTQELAFQLLGAAVIVVSNAVMITVAFQKLRGDVGIISVKVSAVETDIIDLKNTDRRLSVLEDRQQNMTADLSLVKKDNQLIRTEIQSLRLGVDRSAHIVEKYNERV